MTVSECYLIKLLLYILFGKHVLTFQHLEMASPGNWHCSSCIGALSFPIVNHEALSINTDCRGLPTERSGSGQLVDEQLKVRAAGLVVLVVLDVADPELAPDLHQRSRPHVQLHEHQRCHVALRVVVREVGK